MRVVYVLRSCNVNKAKYCRLPISAVFDAKTCPRKRNERHFHVKSSRSGMLDSKSVPCMSNSGCNTCTHLTVPHPQNTHHPPLYTSTHESRCSAASIMHHHPNFSPQTHVGSSPPSLPFVRHSPFPSATVRQANVLRSSSTSRSEAATTSSDTVNPSFAMSATNRDAGARFLGL